MLIVTNFRVILECIFFLKLFCAYTDADTKDILIIW